MKKENSAIRRASARKSAEVHKYVSKMKQRDNNRNLHLGDILVIVTTTDNGVTCMHQKDVDAKEGGAIYGFKLMEIF